jgi:CelD/BcsL family acetyltransferase involved in cellulose biosynthesis
MRVEVITAERDLVAMRDEWFSLWRRCPYATPFQMPEWLIPWWRFFGKGAMRVVAVRDGGALVGLFPFCICDAPNRLLLMGEGISDYLDILVDPGRGGDAMPCMFDFLRQSRAAWEYAELRELRRESPLLTTALPQGFLGDTAPSSVCPVISLPPTVETFTAGLSKVQRRTVRRTMKNIEKIYRVSMATAREGEVEEYLQDFFRLHESRWRALSLPGVLSDARIREFHRQAASGFLGREILRLYSLRFNGRVAASIYALRGNDRMYAYLGGFDPALKELSPGMVALYLVIEDSIRMGIREFDFLRGEEPYKYVWGAVNRGSFRLTLRCP